MQLKTYFKQWWLWVIILIVLVLLGSLIRDNDKPFYKLMPGYNEKLESKETAESKTKIIPGLMAVDITLNLEKKGFKITKHYGQDIYGKINWLCTLNNTSNNLSACIFGNSSTEILRIEATATSFSEIDKFAKDFLCYLMTLPYSGSEPVKAAGWLKDNFNKSNSIILNGVKFEYTKNNMRKGYNGRLIITSI